MSKTFKNTNIILFLLFSFINLPAQNYSIELEKEEFLYAGISHYFKIVTEASTCEDLIVTSSDGQITNLNDCKYKISVDQNDSCTIQIKKGDDFHFQNFEVKSPPLPEITIGGRTALYSNRRIESETIAYLEGIIPLVLKFNHLLIYDIVSYDTYVIADSGFHHYNVSGPLFPSGFLDDDADLVIFDNFVVGHRKLDDIPIAQTLKYPILKEDKVQPECYKNPIQLSNTENGDTILVDLESCNIVYKHYSLDDTSKITLKHLNDEVVLSVIESGTDSLRKTKIYNAENKLVKSYQQILQHKDQFFNLEKKFQFEESNYDRLLFGTYLEYHSNSQVKVKGNYLIIKDENAIIENQLFIESLYGKKLTKSILYSVKDGDWFYYDSDGKRLKVEKYVNGKLKKTKK